MQAQEAPATPAKLVTFDLNQEAAQAIKDGKILFSIDQQPYVQGYMAVDVAVAEPDQRQRHRRRQAGADRPVDRRHDQHRPDPALHRQQHALSRHPPVGSRRRCLPGPCRCGSRPRAPPPLPGADMSSPATTPATQPPKTTDAPAPVKQVAVRACADPSGDRRRGRGDRDLHLLLRDRAAVPHPAVVLHRALRLLHDRDRRGRGGAADDRRRVRPVLRRRGGHLRAVRRPDHASSCR